jgi:hypothetical protein
MLRDPPKKELSCALQGRQHGPQRVVQIEDYGADLSVSRALCATNALSELRTRRKGPETEHR